MRFYLGPYALSNKPSRCWSPPEGTRFAVDLRPIPAQADPVNASGYALFGVPDALVLGADYRLFGIGRGLTDIVPAEADRKVFASMAGVGTVDGSTLAEWLYTLLTLHADPLGDTAVRPLMPTRSKRLEAGGVARRFDLAAPECAKSILVMQDNYRRIRDGGGEMHRKYLDDLIIKFGGDERVYIPDDLPLETRLPRETTIADSFNRADQSGLGSSSEGWSWSAVQATASIVSNQASVAGNVGIFSQRADSDLSTDDHYADITFIQSVVGGGGPATRFASAATTYYKTNPFSDGNIYLQKLVTGTETTISSTAFTRAANDIYRTESDGSTQRSLQNSVQRLSSTDTAITGNLRTGLAGYTSGTAGQTAVFDTFTASDLAAGVVGPLLGGRLINGGVLLGRLVR